MRGRIRGLEAELAEVRERLQRNSGNTLKAEIPEHFRNGCGPRLHALVAELSGIHRNSRRTVQRFLHSFLKLPVSLGGLQRMIDRFYKTVNPWLGKTGPPAAFARRRDGELLERWTFLCVDGMEPTNNRSVPDLRWLSDA
uniref:Uncharacterized protein n=1 Tax=uncultured delta proteobacterium HF0770_45N15 TaxID=710835 RepID=E0XZ01_9DELT|nr:hypothetical protein [uncultured delta proteobacterium HF0770_45N15]